MNGGGNRTESSIKLNDEPVQNAADEKRASGGFEGKRWEFKDGDKTQEWGCSSPWVGRPGSDCRAGPVQTGVDRDFLVERSTSK